MKLSHRLRCYLITGVTGALLAAFVAISPPLGAVIFNKLTAPDDSEAASPNNPWTSMSKISRRLGYSAIALSALLSLGMNQGKPVCLFINDRLSDIITQKLHLGPATH